MTQIDHGKNDGKCKYICESAGGSDIVHATFIARVPSELGQLHTLNTASVFA